MCILYIIVICYREFLLIKGIIVGINCYLIWYIVIVNIDELREMEREGFEFLVNKSLYSSFNVMFWIVWLFFLYNFIMENKLSE